MGYNPYKVKYSVSLVSYGLLAIYIFVSVCRSVFKYRIYGLSLYLLICLFLAVISVVGEAACLLRYFQIGSEDYVTAA
jgi:hypothetical protein